MGSGYCLRGRFSIYVMERPGERSFLELREILKAIRERLNP
jgi:hypothetical protein